MSFGRNVPSPLVPKVVRGCRTVIWPKAPPAAARMMVVIRRILYFIKRTWIDRNFRSDLLFLEAVKPVGIDRLSDGIICAGNNNRGIVVRPGLSQRADRLKLIANGIDWPGDDNIWRAQHAGERGHNRRRDNGHDTRTGKVFIVLKGG